MQRKIISVLLCVSIALSLIIPISAIRDNNGGIDLSDKCRSAILMEASTGEVIYEQDADIPLPPASVTKVMTLLLIMEAIEGGKIKYTDTVRASANACSMGGSQIFLEENEEMSVEDLIKSVVIASANDAAVALAEYVSGTESAFVDKMNAKATELGMKNTFFENTNGLDDTVEKHLTSARDIAIMSRELIKYPKITEYSSIWMDSIRNGEFGLTNTNRLIRFYKGATGLKTGSTAKTGFCISATAQRDGMTLICVIMGAQTRDIRNAAAVSLLDYGFANYCLYSCRGNKILGIPVIKGTIPSVNVEYGDFSCILRKGEEKGIRTEISLPEKLEAPVKIGDIVGEVVYKISEQEIGRREITVSQESDRITFISMLLTFVKNCAKIM